MTPSLFHTRMPVILNAEERDTWLDGSDVLYLGAGAQLKHNPFHRFGIRNDGPDLIGPDL